MLDHFIQIMMVPGVVDECARVGALKTLRSVCRGAREIIMKAIQGFILCLGDKPQSDISELALFGFLKSVDLRHLSVLVHPTCLGGMRCNRTGRCSAACTSTGDTPLSTQTLS